MEMNKTIKVIDLLNKIANGEEVPKKIRYDDDIYEYDYDEKNYAYFFIDIYNYLFDEDITQILDDEVEIIEDNDKLEKIKWNEKESRAGMLRTDQEIEVLARRTETLKKKIAELIDCINKIEERLDER